jgi:alpha-amylase
MPSFQTCVLCLQVSAGDALYRFQEVIYGSGEAVQPEEYVGIGQVTEFRFGVDLYNNFHQGVQNTMQYLVDFGGDSWSLLPSDSAVTFTDNHDTQRSETNVLTYKDGQYYNLANYFMLAHPYGHPKVMSSYYFTDTDAGPPSSSVHSSSSSSSSSSRNQKLRGNDKSSSSGGSDDSVDCGGGSTWVCEHRRGGIANMVKFRLATTRNGTATDVSVAHWYSPSDNGNRAAFGFSTGLGFFAVNMDASSVWDDGDSFETGMADGRYCNAIYSDGQDYYSANGGGLEVGSFKAVLDDSDSSGGCADGSEAITVSGGRASFSVPSLGAVAFYSDSA